MAEVGRPFYKGGPAGKGDQEVRACCQSPLVHFICLGRRPLRIPGRPLPASSSFDDSRPTRQCLRVILDACDDAHGCSPRFTSPWLTQDGLPIDIDPLSQELDPDPDLVLGRWTSPSCRFGSMSHVERGQAWAGTEQTASDLREKPEPGVHAPPGYPMLMRYV